MAYYFLITSTRVIIISLCKCGHYCARTLDGAAPVAPRTLRSAVGRHPSSIAGACPAFMPGCLGLVAICRKTISLPPARLGDGEGSRCLSVQAPRRRRRHPARRRFARIGGPRSGRLRCRRAAPMAMRRRRNDGSWRATTQLREPPGRACAPLVRRAAAYVFAAAPRSRCWERMV